MAFKSDALIYDACNIIGCYSDCMHISEEGPRDYTWTTCTMDFPLPAANPPSYPGCLPVFIRHTSRIQSVIAAHSTLLKSTSSSISILITDQEQCQLKEIMKIELDGATYEEDGFIAKWFLKMRLPSQEVLVKAILIRLEVHLMLPNSPIQSFKTFQSMA
jgi:hypothetical protein